MQKVDGIGGVFFKAQDPAKLSRWYEENLGITPPPPTYDDTDWHQDSGPTVFAPMPVAAAHFKTSANLYINFRVSDLDAMCAQLDANGVAVTIDQQRYPNGRFAELQDPEGNQIQLWEPSR